VETCLELEAALLELRRQRDPPGSRRDMEVFIPGETRCSFWRALGS